MPARNSDGTIRNARSPKILKPRSVRARWVTDEILRCKLTGLSMASIAVHIGRVGQGLRASAISSSGRHRVPDQLPHQRKCGLQGLSQGDGPAA